jgi:phenylalanyl-tRNA synthetase alpha subunit
MSLDLVNRLEALTNDFDEEVKSLAQSYLGKGGKLVDILGDLHDLAPAERAVVGQAINDLKRKIEERLSWIEPPALPTLRERREVLLTAFATALDNCIAQTEGHETLADSQPTFFSAEILLRFQGTTLEVRTTPTLDLTGDVQAQLGAVNRP